MYECGFKITFESLSGKTVFKLSISNKIEALANILITLCLALSFMDIFKENLFLSSGRSKAYGIAKSLLTNTGN